MAFQVDRRLVPEALRLMESVYGPLQADTFPRPMPAGEAGACANGQRRYLWTDAFGVINLVSLAAASESEQEAQGFMAAALKLVTTVHQSLGRPSSPTHPMKPLSRPPSDPNSLEFVGLRIGKVHTRTPTDYGMNYDGMYWHYIDKWLLALVRVGEPFLAAEVAQDVFPHFFDETHKGMRWKLSVDGTPAKGLSSTSPSDDNLTALITFSLIAFACHKKSPTCPPVLTPELAALRASLSAYRPRVTDDPLGWGLEALFDQWLAGRPRQRQLAALAPCALNPAHFSLPFRLYGALIGARISPDLADPSLTDRLVAKALNHQRVQDAHEFEEHSAINRVMLASALLAPGALGRLPDEPELAL
mmetsp:Transcript_45784/g.115257  ORF Transcript_45784/g.115257 Transcript_45784/m.115257 type:complete len:360 (-) Transcript_45784:302-1381(-)|eukprot:CAMPEP_0177640518 /NCGR_PEP_ID=MMETSP0447-20121125/6585_1 /TAXON_ID=0 /ORGANISM="Stygamoeba regulata, Strain BSH-02190019" /LENGTH=359 /DNA_ID=CAMNT_0019142593 /DNA_START=241 /DNA_END=1320 /DNA_ORIENTATION=+